MDSTASQTSAAAAADTDSSHAICDKLFELVDKLTIKLQKKDEELEQKKQENQVCEKGKIFKYL
jgi:hypothetical protein